MDSRAPSLKNGIGYDSYGPGILDLAHQPDEYVRLQDLERSAQVMALATLRLMGEP